MEPPQTIWSFCTFLFRLMGTVFVLLGAFFTMADISVNGRPGWCFIPIGAIVFLFSFGCFFYNLLLDRRIKHLKAEGISVTGKIQSTQHLIWINWNTKTFVNWPGQCSPWVIQCSYCYQGQAYTVKSSLSWLKPSPGPQHPVIYFDPHNPVHAFVDMDTVKWEL